jgi:hypothetical protein
MYENVCLDSILVRQLKHKSFICNALNYFNEKKKVFKLSHSLSLSNFLFISSYFMFNCLNEKKNKRFTNYLSLYFSFNLLLLSLYIYISRVLM